jgi:hypothetical protein
MTQHQRASYGDEYSGDGDADAQQTGNGYFEALVFCSRRCVFVKWLTHGLRAFR